MITSNSAPTWTPFPASVAGPRVIEQISSIFLVSRCGELWRVFDSATLAGASRVMPSPDSTLPYRIFLAVGRSTNVRIHTFAPGARPAIDSMSLQAQLDESQAD